MLQFLICTHSLVVFTGEKKLTRRVRTAHSISVIVTISSCTLPWSSEHWAHITGTAPTAGFSSETETLTENGQMMPVCLIPISQASVLHHLSCWFIHMQTLGLHHEVCFKFT